MKYNAITVSELNSYIKEKIAEDEMLANVLVKGEISNFKHFVKSNTLLPLSSLSRFCSINFIMSQSKLVKR